MKISSIGWRLIAAATILAGAMTAPTSSAAIVVSVQTPNFAFAPDSGIQSINVFARGNDGINSPDSGQSISVDFALSGGASFASPNAGTFGGIGFIGNGNITAGGSSFLRDPGNPNFGNLSIEFDSVETLLLTDRLLATLSIDTAGLSPGTYMIDIIDAQLDGEPGVFTGGSFEIAPVAIPEPSAVALVIALGTGVWARKRYRIASLNAAS